MPGSETLKCKKSPIFWWSATAKPRQNRFPSAATAPKSPNPYLYLNSLALSPRKSPLEQVPLPLPLPLPTSNPDPLKDQWPKRKQPKLQADEDSPGHCQTWYTKTMSAKKITMQDVFKNPRYRGKHVILAAGKVFTANTGSGAAEILRKVRKQYPNVTPQVAYLPKAHSLIL